MGFVEFFGVFRVGFVILEMFRCCVFFYVCEPLFVGMNSNLISPFFGYFSDLGKRSSRDDDTDLLVGPSHGVDDDRFGFIGDGAWV